MAKKNFALIFLLAALVAAIVLPIKISAAINRPFGGRVITFLPIACPDGFEVFNIKPASFAPAGPYYISASTKRFKYFSVSPGRLILGLYNPVPVICTGGTPPAPVPVFKIVLFGSSLF